MAKTNIKNKKKQIERNIRKNNVADYYHYGHGLYGITSPNGKHRCYYISDIDNRLHRVPLRVLEQIFMFKKRSTYGNKHIGHCIVDMRPMDDVPGPTYLKGEN